MLTAGFECLADVPEQRLGNRREPIQRMAARAQEEHLDCRGDATIVAVTCPSSHTNGK